jgi:hypothetical protein
MVKMVETAEMMEMAETTRPMIQTMIKEINRMIRCRATLVEEEIGTFFENFTAEKIRFSGTLTGSC